MIDLLALTKSKTRQAVLSLFLENPGQDFYLREIARRIGVSAANVRRELVLLVGWGLCFSYRKGRLVYYALNAGSPMLAILTKAAVQENPFVSVWTWAQAKQPTPPPDALYCLTRDVFQARLENQLPRWEKSFGQDAYLLTAIAGEIGNNSFDHNLGNWPDIAGVFFAADDGKRRLVIADRGRGILATIRFVRPHTKSHVEALHIAFTERLSGRADEHRGNGLKFVRRVVAEKKWKLALYSGDSVARVGTGFAVGTSQRIVPGCLAMIAW